MREVVTGSEVVGVLRVERLVVGAAVGKRGETGRHGPIARRTLVAWPASVQEGWVGSILGAVRASAWLLFKFR